MPNLGGVIRSTSEDGTKAIRDVGAVDVVKGNNNMGPTVEGLPSDHLQKTHLWTRKQSFLVAPCGYEPCEQPVQAGHSHEHGCGPSLHFEVDQPVLSSHGPPVDNGSRGSKRNK